MYELPATVVVPGRVQKGAIVREGAELDSALVDTIEVGRELTVVQVHIFGVESFNTEGYTGRDERRGDCAAARGGSHRRMGL